MNTLTISNQAARRFLLAHQFLYPSSQLKGKAGVHTIFERFGCIQYDTINVVGRNADLVLQSRIQNYSPTLLNEMLYTDRTLVDGWDKMASLYQMKDWPFFARRRKHMYEYHHLRAPETAAYGEKILAVIREQGPVSSLDFKDEEGTQVDWFWAPTKLARATLETLNAKGAVGIHHKINTRRVFDLAENLYPEEYLYAEDPHSKDEDFKRWHILRRLGSMGLASLRSGEYWLGMQLLRKSTERKSVIETLVEQGEVLAVGVEGHPETLYMRAADLPTLEQAQNGKTPRAQAAFIAPLDNLIWNRRLIGELFGFTYIWEVYKPKKDRQYGYYTMPVLYGDKFVARMDAKLDRKSNVLTLNGWWWEDNVKVSSAMQNAVKARFKKFMKYLNTEKVAAGDQVEKKDYVLLPS